MGVPVPESLLVKCANTPEIAEAMYDGHLANPVPDAAAHELHRLSMYRFLDSELSSADRGAGFKLAVQAVMPAAVIAPQADQVIARMDRLDERMNGFDARMDRFEERMDQLGARMDVQFAAMTRQITDLGSRMDANFHGLSRRVESVERSVHRGEQLDIQRNVIARNRSRTSRKGLSARLKLVPTTRDGVTWPEENGVDLPYPESVEMIRGLSDAHVVAWLEYYGEVPETEDPKLRTDALVKFLTGV